MAGWAEEYDSAVILADTAARELKELDPNHELLKYWFLSEKEDAAHLIMC